MLGVDAMYLEPDWEEKFTREYHEYNKVVACRMTNATAKAAQERIELLEHMIQRLKAKVGCR